MCGDLTIQQQWLPPAQTCGKRGELWTGGRPTPGQQQPATRPEEVTQTLKRQLRTSQQMGEARDAETVQRPPLPEDLEDSCSELSDDFPPEDNEDFALSCVNAQGVGDRLRMDVFSALLEKSNVLVVLESHLTHGRMDTATHYGLNFPHYYSSREDPTPHVGEVTFFISKTLSPQELPTSTHLGPLCAAVRMSVPNLEKKEGTLQTVHLVGAYIPPTTSLRYSSSSTTPIWEAIEAYLLQVPKGEFRILCGDFNAHIRTETPKIAFPRPDVAAMPVKRRATTFLPLHRQSRDLRPVNTAGKQLMETASTLHLALLNGTYIPQAWRAVKEGDQNLRSETPSLSTAALPPDLEKVLPLLWSAIWSPDPSLQEFTYFRKRGVSGVDYALIDSDLLPFLKSFTIRRDREVGPDHTILRWTLHKPAKRTESLSSQLTRVAPAAELNHPTTPENRPPTNHPLETQTL
uniref:Endonuclease/exonuclease/phosphatase domain-containing protein n=1 Tax=Chromera velia CCMP2878 TaxID=1169474 RepID=A0A0G4HGG7_9ALVE|eukprot:Cvel_27226.t1-p1 / transcript=Cvel_27226.t1 / gene=Cvel_27226 / organism=Chromera_velia_CCMP2878 / gene_product=hypothetical protein / transcript_product=hypothetical protein / location=Cvel_scaffold3367:9656-11035(+) / protein_length=460 / sequence_SO=supercontig / SO=protein_coding / is_pseudo=false